MIYLDNAATTQIDPVVLEAMWPYLATEYGNPGGLYGLGRSANAAVQTAREKVRSHLRQKRTCIQAGSPPGKLHRCHRLLLQRRMDRGFAQRQRRDPHRP